MKLFFLISLSIMFSWSALKGLDYPGAAPGKVHLNVTDTHINVENAAIFAQWALDEGRIKSFILKNMHSGNSFFIKEGHLPEILLQDGGNIDLGSLIISEPVIMENNKITARFINDASGLSMKWSVSMNDDDNAIIQTLQLTALNDTEIESLVFFNAPVESARQAGNVDGSVIVCKDLFMAVEHPLAKNEVNTRRHVRCLLPRGNILIAGETWIYTSVFGAVPPGQLRRGFLYYLERRRAHPYRPFLHYNNWYNVYLARPVERTNEAECLKTINIFGEKLIRERGVKMDAFVWDDGWDDFNSLWDFHKGFPEGFKNLDAAADKYGASQGVWMSPWGGYGPAKEKRISYGESFGYETNAGGFSMAGKKYGKAFRNVCMKMMRKHGVTFFKFDGMGKGNTATGAEDDTADDIDAILDLTKKIRHENSEVFISATIGTWASPYWLLYACSIWRQGGDNGMHGEGDTRQQWITYRDKFSYERIVKMGPLYPLNSLMTGGIIISSREGRSPSRFVINEKSVADEIWTFFGSGTCLQELYIDPESLTDSMWNTLAKAANWSRKNSDLFVDTHWIGGDPGKGEIYGWASWRPGKGEIYGWASWRPGKGILVLRNPSGNPKAFTLSLQSVFELPDGASFLKSPKVIYPQEREQPSWPSDVEESFSLNLQPFEVVVVELQN